MTKTPPESQIDGAVAATANVWLGLGAATGYLVWALRIPTAPESIDTALSVYGWSLIAGLIASGIVVLVLRLAAGASIGSLGLVSYVSCLFYLGFGKVFGGDAVPWAVVAAALVVLLVRRRSSVPVKPPLLLLHAMGTMSGLYLFFHLREFWSAEPAFRDVLQALWIWISAARVGS